MKYILWTREENRVRVTVPAPNCMKALCNGGGLVDHKNKHQSIDHMVSAGFDPSFVIDWINALMWGGCSSAEAYALIRDRSAKSDATAPELVSLNRIPPDRWFRDAWSRHGGRIVIDLERARAVQAARIWHGHKEFKSSNEKDNAINQMSGRNYFIEIPDLDLMDWQKQIITAKSVAELRAVWPAWLHINGS